MFTCNPFLRKPPDARWLYDLVLRSASGNKIKRLFLSANSEYHIFTAAQVDQELNQLFEMQHKIRKLLQKWNILSKLYPIVRQVCCDQSKLVKNQSIRRVRCPAYDKSQQIKSVCRHEVYLKVSCNWFWPHFAGFYYNTNLGQSPSLLDTLELSWLSCLS